MPEKMDLVPFDENLLKVIKPGSERTILQWAGLWKDESLPRVRAREHAQTSAPDLRMVVRVQRKNKHPHSTKKHK
jgi:hypothetical protein